MSWSLRLQNGDLALSGASLGTVTNEHKLVQDLRCWILERMGTDNLHPSFGSLIDGGMRPDGTISQGVIGNEDPELVLLFIESELHRIVAEYQAQQLIRAKSDRLTYNKSTLTAREVLLSVKGISAKMVADSINITLSIETATSGALDIAFAVPADGALDISAVSGSI